MNITENIKDAMKEFLEFVSSENTTPQRLALFSVFQEYVETYKAIIPTFEHQTSFIDSENQYVVSVKYKTNLLLHWVTIKGVIKNGSISFITNTYDDYDRAMGILGRN